jgi:uncharacterized protein (TIGR03435 family)
MRPMNVASPRALLVLIAAAVALATLSESQGRPKSDGGAGLLPSFEIVSIKPYPHNYWPTSSFMEFTADGFNARNMIVQPLLVYAYDLHDPRFENRQRLIPGGEKWMLWDWFDIQARMSAENIAELRQLNANEREVYKRQLIQSMLADRFKLKVHPVSRESLAWELILAKGGPRNMKTAPDGEESRPFPSDLNHIRWQAAPISMLIDLLTDLEQAPVIDKTGLTGKYDFKLEFSRETDAPLPPGVSLPATNDSEPLIRDALVDQLGLKLVPTKIALDEIVIDHIEKPSPN